MKQEVTVNGMTCQGCANAVKTKFEKIKGIDSVKIDLENKKAILETEIEIPKDSLQTVLEDTNYEVV
ncbi:MAG TPA: heavy metal-associated domain-containing protein [Atopostipes sp.]|jgi:Copper chaperone|nr:heavy metal-associated domain-containing protein [Atopostipes sp.]